MLKLFNSTYKIMNNFFKGYGTLSSGILHITPKEAFELISKGAIIIDLRDPDYLDYKVFDTDKLINIPLPKLKDNIDNLLKKGPIILADSSGLHSKKAVKLLKDKGFENVANMAGGFVEWERDGLPVGVDINERLTGSCTCQLKPRERKK